MPVTATIQVAFSSDEAEAAADLHLSARIDDREDGLNAGDTDFAPGDTAYFLVYESANVTHENPIPSAGSVVPASAGVVEHEEIITFADTDEASLQVPPSAITDVQWYGTSLGTLTVVGGTAVKASASGVAVAKVTYNAAPTAYGLVSPEAIDGETDFSILVFILGHET